MSHQTKISSLLLLFGAIIQFQTVSTAQQTDRVTGLIQEDGWQLVQANCTACHTTQIIMQNSGSREVWKSRIVWMQETQGLWPLDAATENGILDYLEKNYAPSSAHRRAPLPPAQMPPNPYSEQENI